MCHTVALAEQSVCANWVSLKLCIGFVTHAVLQCVCTGQNNQSQTSRGKTRELHKASMQSHTVSSKHTYIQFSCSSKYNNNICVLIPMGKWLFRSCTYMIAPLEGFKVLSKETSTCGQEEPGIEPLTRRSMGDCSTNSFTVAQVRFIVVWIWDLHHLI